MESQALYKSKIKVSANVSYSKNNLTISLNEEIDTPGSLSEESMKALKKQMIARNADLILELFSNEEENKKK